MHAAGRRGLHLAALVLVFCAGVAPISADDQCEDPPRWHLPGTPLPGPPPGGCGRTKPWPYAFFPVERPEAHYARARFHPWFLQRQTPIPKAFAEDTDMAQRFLTLNLSAEGYVYMGVYEFDLGYETDPDGRWDEWALADAVRELSQDKRHGPNAAVRLHGDREAPWRFVRVCLRAALAVRSSAPEALHILVRGNRRHRERYVPMRLRHRTPGDTAPKGDLTHVIVTREGKGEEGRTVLRCGNHTFRFPAGRFKDAAFVREANAVWREFSRYMASRSPEPFVTVLLDDALDVPWAYIVSVIDVLAGLGVKRVNLPSAPPARELTPDEIDDRNTPLPPYPPYTHEGVTGMVLEIQPLPGPAPLADCSPVSREGPPWPVLVLVGLLAAAFAYVVARRRS